MKKTLLFLILFACILKSYKSNAQVNLRDSLALIALYDSTSGASWTDQTNWLTAKPLNEWYGIKVPAPLLPAAPQILRSAGRISLCCSLQGQLR